MNPLEIQSDYPNLLERGEDRYEFLEKVLNIEVFMETVDKDTDKLYKFLTNPKLRGVKIPVGEPERYIRDVWGERKYWNSYVKSRQEYWKTYLENRDKTIIVREEDGILSKETVKKDPLVIKEGDLIAFREILEENRRIGEQEDGDGQEINKV